MNIKTSLVAAALLTTGAAQATCFSVYKADGTVIHESSTTPVDLSQQIGDTIALKFGPGASMTMSEHGVYCRDRAGVAGKGTSLADAVRAEEQKTMLVKAPEVQAEAVKAVALKAEPAKTELAKAEPANAELAKVQVAKEDGAKTVLVKDDGTKTVVETQQGTVLKVKVKAKAKEAQ
jgi:hypothetical protein